MSRDLLLDSHKLFYHPERVADFLAGRRIRPLYAEISPTSVCNHRCLFCNFNYLGHEVERIPDGRMPTLVDELGQIGVKAIVFAGAGEPSLHKDTFPAVRRAVEQGIDVAMSTNGALLKDDQIEEMARNLVWVRFSVNGGTPESYAASQGTRADDWEKALSSLERLARRRDALGSRVTIGSQCVLIPENKDGIFDLARRLKACGANYFSIKHFYPHEDNPYKPDMSFLTDEFVERLKELAAELTDDNFKLFVRDPEKLARERPYTVCHGLPFIIYLRENGRLYTCFSHQDDERTAVGSFLEQDLVSLWESPGQERALAHINAAYDKNLCQANCRHHQINLFLEQLSHVPAHVNFI